MKILILWLAFGQDVHDLGADEWAVRQAAEARLTRWRPLCWHMLDRPFRDLERHHRARRIVAAELHLDAPPLPLVLLLPRKDTMSAIWTAGQVRRLVSVGVPYSTWCWAPYWARDEDGTHHIRVEWLRAQAAEQHRALARAGVPGIALDALMGWSRSRERALTRAGQD